MNFPQSGGCQCGTVRYEITGPPTTVYACHCTECQTQSGSAFAMAAVIPAAISGWRRARPGCSLGGRVRRKQWNAGFALIAARGFGTCRAGRIIPTAMSSPEPWTTPPG